MLQASSPAGPEPDRKHIYDSRICRGTIDACSGMGQLISQLFSLFSFERGPGFGKIKLAIMNRILLSEDEIDAERRVELRGCRAALCCGRKDVSEG